MSTMKKRQDRESPQSKSAPVPLTTDQHPALKELEDKKNHVTRLERLFAWAKDGISQGGTTRSNERNFSVTRQERNSKNKKSSAKKSADLGVRKIVGTSFTYADSDGSVVPYQKQNLSPKGKTSKKKGTESNHRQDPQQSSPASFAESTFSLSSSPTGVLAEEKARGELPFLNDRLLARLPQEERDRAKEVIFPLVFRLVRSHSRKIYISLNNAVEWQLSELTVVHKELAKQFHAHGIDYSQEILPLFEERWNPTINLLIGRQAIDDVVKEYQRQLRLADGAIRMLTKVDTLCSQGTKERLRQERGWLPRPRLLKEVMLQNLLEKIYKKFSTPTNKKLLAKNTAKTPHKQPVWRDFEMELFQMLRNKVLKKDALRLIETLQKSLFSYWFDVQEKKPPWYDVKAVESNVPDVKHPRDAIRLNIGRRVKAKHP